MILFPRRGIVNRKNTVRPLEAVDAPKEPPGIPAREPACHMIDDARRADVDLLEGRVEEITPGREVVSGKMRARGKMLILANGSTAAEAGTPRGREFAGRDRGGVHE